jgi:hypothetical protein
MDHWLTSTAAGLIIIGLVTIFLAAGLARIAGKLWRRYLGGMLLGVLRFLQMYVRPFVISRVLTNRYIHKKDYFKYASHTGVAIMSFALASATQLALITLIGVCVIVNGIRLSWSLLILFCLSGFQLVRLVRTGFYLYGVIEQTYDKDLKRYREIFPKLHRGFFQRLMNEDVETVLKEQEQALAHKGTAKPEASKS